MALPSREASFLTYLMQGKELRQGGEVTVQGPVERTGGEGRPSGSGLAWVTSLAFLQEVCMCESQRREEKGELRPGLGASGERAGLMSPLGCVLTPSRVTPEGLLRG